MVNVPKPPATSPVSKPVSSPKPKHNSIRIIYIIIGAIVIANLIFFDAALYYFGNQLMTNDETVVSEDTSDSDTSGLCDGNVAGIELHGEVVTYIAPANTDDTGATTTDQTASEDVVWAIKDADQDANIKSILLEIDSRGGSPIAGEEIATALKLATKPTVVLIRQSGDSAAYLAATGSKMIFASENSDVGSIGVTMSYLDYSKQNESAGVTYQQLSSGQFKDTGDPDKVLTEAERKYLERDIVIMKDNFIGAVSRNRQIPIDEVRTLADGSSMLGQMALDKRLIDRLGGMPEVESYLREQNNADPVICWY
jgi:protease-4